MAYSLEQYQVGELLGLAPSYPFVSSPYDLMISILFAI